MSRRRTSGSVVVQCTKCWCKAWRGVYSNGHFPPFLPVEQRLTTSRCLRRSCSNGWVVLSSLAPGEKVGVPYPPVPPVHEDEERPDL